MQPHLATGAILTDVGSVKAAILRDCAAFVPKGVHLIPGHPIAGTEHSGPEAGFASLFDNRWCVLTPAEGTDMVAVEKLKAFWQGLGSKVVKMSPAEHDAAVAATSHLPHLIASALAAATPAELLPLTATGWGDTTRVASGDVDLWRQIFLDNRVNTLKALASFERVLTELRAALEAGDGAALARLLQQGKRIRDTVGS